MRRKIVWRDGARFALAAMAVSAASPAADALECKPKTTGYFQQMPAFAKAPSPADLAGMTQSLTGSIGDPARGRLVVIDRQKGNCLACHRVPALGEEPSHGDVGPNLNGVGGRFTESQLRQIVVDPKVMYPDTVMPAYHAVPDFKRVPRNLAGQPVLEPGEVEDVIAYLKDLR